MIEASDCKCNRCGKKAVAFWPVIDPDIHNLPWCRLCLNVAKDKLIIDLFTKLSLDRHASKKKTKKA